MRWSAKPMFLIRVMGVVTDSYIATSLKEALQYIDDDTAHFFPIGPEISKDGLLSKLPAKDRKKIKDKQDELATLAKLQKKYQKT